MRPPLLCLPMVLLLAPPLAPARGQETERADPEIVVSIDESGQSGHARASELVRAPAAVIAGLIRSCPETLRIVPGLRECRVLESAPDGSWQIVRQVEDHWLLPTMTYEFRCTWESPTRVRLTRVAGDLRVLEGLWQMEPAHGATRVHYDVDVAPDFWVPRWMVKLALRHDLPKMLRALKARAESIGEDRAAPLAQDAHPAAGSSP